VGRHSNDVGDESRLGSPEADYEQSRRLPAPPSRYFAAPPRPLNGRQPQRFYAGRSANSYGARRSTFGAIASLLLVGAGATLQAMYMPIDGLHWACAALTVIGMLLSLGARNRTIRSLAITVAVLCVLNAASTGGTPVGPQPALVDHGNSGPPRLSAEGARAARAAGPSVVEVWGSATQCGRLIEGSGFTYETGRVITNAHVVAGTDTVSVETADGGPLPATVIFYDPNVDIAVLSVPHLTAKPLNFAPAAAKAGDDAIVLGYPEDRPYTAAPAIVGATEAFPALNLDGTATTSRAVYPITATVLNGNSGGPLITPGGRVLGVVFAKALDSSDTGLVLTNHEIKDDLKAAAAAPLNPRTPITGNCSTR
jgi:hypothetical protein